MLRYHPVSPAPYGPLSKNMTSSKIWKYVT